MIFTNILIVIYLKSASSDHIYDGCLVIVTSSNKAWGLKTPYHKIHRKNWIQLIRLEVCSLGMAANKTCLYSRLLY
jgi:hypothetical protein